jgi:hypothetical protein
MTTDRVAECNIVRRQAEALVHLAQQLGVTLRIDLHPLQPPAMGHHEPVIEVWPARHQQPEPTKRLYADD